MREYMNLIIIALTFIFEDILMATLVGLSFYAVKTKLNWRLSNKLTFIILFVIFFFLDIYMLPAISSLDATITVGNEFIAKLFDIKPDTPLNTICMLGWFNIFVYAVQVFIALIIVDPENWTRDKV